MKFLLNTLILSSSYLGSLIQCSALPTNDVVSTASVDVPISESSFIPEEPPQPDPDATKYFHEHGMDDYERHYDARYYHKILNNTERRETLQYLIKSYLENFEQLGLETWIAHGTLLGWFWSAKILPWDWDLDTQVTGQTLMILADKYNHTFYDYQPGNQEPPRRYLLDINPWARERIRGDGNNIIDGRWIDTSNGMFVDITGLSEVHPDTAPGVLMCKNLHRYRPKDIFPLRKTTFEDVNANIPYAYAAILEDEYTPSSLSNTVFEGHRWDLGQQEWIRMPTEEEEKKMQEDTLRDEAAMDGAYS